MAKIEPIDPIEPTGDGKSTAERIKRGMPNSDPEVQKDFAERLQKYIDQGKAERAARNEFKKVEANTRVGGVGGGGGGGAADMPPGFMPGKGGGKGPITYKKGGKITASTRGDGIAKRGKTKGRMV